MPNLNDPAEAVAWLRSPQAIRARCAAVLEAARADGLAHFALRAERLEVAADYVAQTIRANYPTPDTPLTAAGVISPPAGATAGLNRRPGPAAPRGPAAGDG